MCGILGRVPAADPIPFKQALDKLYHRGPDGYGTWSDDVNITLGHRRLSILDVSDNGKQPMHYGNYVITFNGEIYNFLEIRKELEKSGYTFKSDSDTEVVLAAYTKWGEGCFLKFNGMWALAIWDKLNNKLVLSRDRFGKKPLFYTLSKQFVFASEMKAIIPFLDEVRPSDDFDWCRQNIFLYESTDKCLIAGIKRFPAGSIGVFDFDSMQLSVKKFWNTLDHLQEVPADYNEQVEQFRELFIDACKIRMRSDVSIGTTLSGGLDSTATICTMDHINKQHKAERQSNDWQHAFVASIKNTPWDEADYARSVTDKLGINNTFITVDGAGQYDKLQEYIYLCEDLYMTSPIPMIQTYKAVREGGVVVTIDGHGADELLCGYNYDFYEAAFDEGFDFKVFKQLVNTRKSTLVAGYKGPGNIEAAKELTQYVGRINMVNLMHVANRRILKNRMRLPIKRYKKLEGLSHFNSLLYNMSHNTILPTLLRNYDRYSMASSVEVRMPFLDYRVVTFLLSIPWNSKIKNGFTKAILRDALKDIMPQEILSRKSKVGFNTPMLEWMKGPWKEELEDTLSSSAFINASLINAKEVSKKIRQIINNPAATYADGVYAWQEFMPYLWERSFITNAGNETSAR
ncbi:asparagine synthase (glutamine-hydrolyzing) [Aridibaculum aurantiacum]|uniref:asparagine synthase (glutamine-hydrolyzing) n=1 Tax=Aridibaculum aurantiacum TaxID=2810307 RepID=UPI001A95B1D0